MSSQYRAAVGLFIAAWGTFMLIWMAAPQLLGTVPVEVLLGGNIGMIFVGALLLPWRLW